jgi:hypothetical protein
MAITVQMQFESAVTELYEDAFIGSSIENGTTIRDYSIFTGFWYGSRGAFIV